MLFSGLAVHGLDRARKRRQVGAQATHHARTGEAIAHGRRRSGVLDGGKHGQQAACGLLGIICSLGERGALLRDFDRARALALAIECGKDDRATADVLGGFRLGTGHDERDGLAQIDSRLFGLLERNRLISQRFALLPACQQDAVRFCCQRIALGLPRELCRLRESILDGLRCRGSGRFFLFALALETAGFTFALGGIHGLGVARTLDFARIGRRALRLALCCGEPVRHVLERGVFFDFGRFICGFDNHGRFHGL